MTDNVLPADPSVVRVSGRDVSVGVLTMGQLLKVRKIFEGGKLESLAANVDLLGVIEAFPEEMMQVAMVATDLTQQELDDAGVDEFVFLCAEILEKNADFFARRLGPSLQKLLGQLVKVAALAGGFKRSSS